MDSRKSLMVSIVNFLKSEIESGHLDEDSKEGLEGITFCLFILVNSTGFPKWGRLVGVQIGQNGQKRYENYKISI